MSLIKMDPNFVRTEFNPLYFYAERILSSSILSWRPPANAIKPGIVGVSGGQLSGLVLDRQGQFQTELFIIPHEVKEIRAHIHPGIDSFEFSVAGDFNFIVNGQKYSSDGDGTPIGLRNFLAKVDQDTPHGGLFTTGGAILSFQHWLNNVPPNTVSASFVETEPLEHTDTNG
jgi:hypothetical protein